LNTAPPRRVIEECKTIDTLNQFARNHSARERILLALFPSAIVLAIYSVFWAVPLQRTKTSLKREFVHQQSVAVSPREALDSMRVLNDEKQILERMRQRVQMSQLQIREMSESWRSRDSRLETLEKISELMEDYNLSIVSQGDREGVIVSGFLGDLFQMMDSQSLRGPIEFWQVRVVGTYIEVADFLAEVNKNAQKIIPVGITMDAETQGSTRKNWTIVFAN
jgi:hypothetical protein